MICCHFFIEILLNIDIYLFKFYITITKSGDLMDSKVK